VLTATRRAAVARRWREGRLGPWGAALAPAAWAYRGALAVRAAAYATGLLGSTRVPCRVVAVGNLTVGGTGKTPLVELVARRLAAGGRRVVVVSRGYGGRARGPAAVSDRERVLLDAGVAGDEPVLLARRLPGIPVVVGADRGRAGRWVVERLGADVLVLDDGFQQRRLRTDVAVVCLDAERPWGSGRLVPAGPLREPPDALGRAHLVVLTGGPPAAPVERDVRARAPGAVLAWGTHRPEDLLDLATGESVPLAALAGRAVLAFAGIARPDRFAATLAGAGGRLRAQVAFPDHHPYAAGDLRDLAARARDAGAEVLVTTEKDAVRLPPTPGLRVWALRVRLELQGDAAAWWAALEALA
jgi:tetraacyldisaccharide 4'-kinase